MREKTIVVTGCDANHFDLAEDLLTSLRDLPRAPFAIGFVHVGASALPDAIASRADLVVALDDAEFAAAGSRAGNVVSYLGVKARLPELFPSFDTYVWLDGDTWVQDGQGLEQVAEAAQHADFAVAPECDVRYFKIQVPVYRNVSIYYQLFPNLDLPNLVQRPMINSGVVAARATSPLWPKWSGLLAEIRRNYSARRDVYYSDQIPLHLLACRGELTLTPLSALDNWQLWAELPSVNFERQKLLSPYWPFEAIRIMHLAGESKHGTFRLGDTDRTMTFRYRDVKALFQAVRSADELRARSGRG